MSPSRIPSACMIAHATMLYLLGADAAKLAVDLRVWTSDYSPGPRRRRCPRHGLARVRSPSATMRCRCCERKERAHCTLHNAHTRFAQRPRAALVLFRKNSGRHFYVALADARRKR